MARADSGDPRSLGHIECLSSDLEPVREYGGFELENREESKHPQDKIAQDSEERLFCPTCSGSTSLMMYFLKFIFY